jgi:hypothetical protein
MRKHSRSRVVAALGAGGVLAGTVLTGAVLQTGFGLAGLAGRVLKVADATGGARTLFASYAGAENYALLLRPIPVTLPVGGGSGGGGGGGGD